MDEIQQLLVEYMSENRYISCLEELYVLFEKNNISSTERITIMKEIYMYNKKIYALEERKSQELDNIKNYDKASVMTEKSSILTTSKSKKIVEALQFDISKYMEKIKNVNDISDLEKILPSRDNEQFDNIVDMIAVGLYKEKVEIINLIHEQQEKEPFIHEFFDSELEDIDFKIEILLDYKNMLMESKENCTQNVSNRVVFLKNTFGEPMIVSSLKGYEEYYESFLELINSIVDGSFKNKRSFSNNSKVIDMMEVKGFKTRVLFSHLKDNIYVIMPAFVKKCDTDLRHRNILENVSQIYQIQKEELLYLINNEEYMIKEEGYLGELLDILKEKKKVNIK